MMDRYSELQRQAAREKTAARARGDHERRLANLPGRIDRALRKARGSRPTEAAITEAKMPGARILEGYGNVFNLPDYQGDIVLPGAFDRWHREHKASGEPIPLMLEHRWEDPDAVLGWSQAIRIDAHGLWASFALLSEVGEKILRDVRSGFRSGLSIGYTVHDERDPTWPESEKGAKRVLTDVSVREISLVREPANVASRAYSVKCRAQLLAESTRAMLAAQPYRRGKGLMDVAAQDDLRTRITGMLGQTYLSSSELFFEGLEGFDDFDDDAEDE